MTTLTSSSTDAQALIATDIANPVIVIGSGPTGIRFVQKYLAKDPQAALILFGNEPYHPYNRVQLSSVLAGDVARDAIDYAMPNAEEHPNFSYIVCAIKRIDPQTKTITDALGCTHRYGKLVLATGSRPFVPNIPGIDQKGVYTFRNLKDTDALSARLSSAKHIVVVGGGLLGIEAARALQRLNTKITLIHQGSRLMNRQLDDAAATQLQEKLEQLTIHISLNSGVRVVHGMNRVEGVTLRNGERIDCDTVLFCTGVICNTELAQEAGLKTARGVVVNDQLQTSDDAIYAIGECCEHNHQVHGFAAPGMDQAAVAADAIAGGKAHYLGSLASSRLKVVNEDVFSQGEVCDFVRHGTHREIIFKRDDLYRKLVVQNGKLIGLLGIGAWPELPRLQELYQQQRTLYPWQLWLFKWRGSLWLNEKASDARHWPEAAIVCQCNQVSQGELTAAIAQGCTSREALTQATQAGGTCGSCKPLLNQLLGSSEPAEKDRAWPIALICSLLAIILALSVISLPGLTVPDSVQEPTALGGIWNDKFWKQVTGFSLLGLTAIGLVMSLRKRIQRINFGDFSYWRALHIALGVVCVITLIAHTGMHLGSNLNRYLMIDFLLVITLGAAAGIAVSMSHRLSPNNGMRLRKRLSWVHLLVSWPLPILLTLHILSVYYF